MNWKTPHKRESVPRLLFMIVLGRVACGKQTHFSAPVSKGEKRQPEIRLLFAGNRHGDH